MLLSALRRWRSAHPHVQMLSHQALLFALPLAFLMAALFPFQPLLAPTSALAPAPQPTMLPRATPPQVQPLTYAPAEASPTVAVVQADKGIDLGRINHLSGLTKAKSEDGKRLKEILRKCNSSIS